MIPPMSSATASVARKTYRLFGTRPPREPRTARAKAISVAIGIAAPRLSG